MRRARGTRARGSSLSCAARPEALCLAWPAIVGYLRIATHPSIFADPLSHEQAATNLQALLALPHARTLSEQDGFWKVYRDVARDIAPRGNLVPDAHLAALLKQHGVTTIYTNDRDFRKFAFLDVRSPFE